jgi:hypothetical protein
MHVLLDPSTCIYLSHCARIHIISNSTEVFSSEVG